MSKNFGVAHTGVILVLALSFLGVVFTSTALSQDFQRMPIVLHAPDVLPRELLTGPNYKVKNIVISDGIVNIYELDTFYGPLKVESTALLLKRINELKAIHRIDQLKESDVYLNALKQAGAAPLRTAEGLVTDPVGTVSGVATGIGHFFSNIERSVTSKDPYQPGAADALLGQAAYKRQFAYEFGVDPYSSYAPLQKALDDLSWTATAGGLTVKTAMMAIPGAAGTLVGMGGTAQSLKALVSEKTPGELEEMNRGKLSGLGIPDYLVQAFLNNMSYDPQEKTLLVGALANMVGVNAPAVYIQNATAAHDESIALFMRVRAQLMELYNEKSGPVATFINANGTPFLLTKEGKAIGIFPLDYIAWTPRLSQKEATISAALQAMPGISGKELWIMGKVDAEARKALERRGWKVEDNIQERFFKKLQY